MNQYISRVQQVCPKDIKRLQSTYALNELELAQIQRLGVALQGKIDSVIDEFYVWLEQQAIWPIFFSEAGKADKLKKNAV